MGKVYKKRVKGSYTIEASLIFPFILYIIIALIYLGFYLHDYGKMQAIIYEGQIRGKGLVINEVNMDTGILSYDDYLNRTVFYPIENDFENKELQIKNFINSCSHDKLLISKIKDIKVEVKASNITITVSMKMNFPFNFLEKLFFESGNIVIENKEKNTQPVDFIRGFQVSADVGERIDIVNEVINKLKKAFDIIK